MKSAYPQILRLQRLLEWQVKKWSVDLRVDVMRLNSKARVFRSLAGNLPPRLLLTSDAAGYLEALGVNDPDRKAEILNSAKVYFGHYDREVLEILANPTAPDFLTTEEALGYLGLDGARARCLRELGIPRIVNPDRTRWPGRRFMYRRADLDAFVEWCKTHPEEEVCERWLPGFSNHFRNHQGHEPPTTACFDCGRVVPVDASWSSREQPELALCETCFRSREATGRAKETVRVE